jgi:hypothetical protein
MVKPSKGRCLALEQDSAQSILVGGWNLHIIPLMMEDMVSETLGFYPQMTRLLARDFINEKASFTKL